MKKHIVLVGIVIMILMISLCGCSENILESIQSEEQRVVGTWKGMQNFNNSAILTAYVFYADNTFNGSASLGGQAQRWNGTWRIADTMFIFEVNGQIQPNEYLFSSDGNQLTIIENGAPFSLIRQ